MRAQEKSGQDEKRVLVLAGEPVLAEALLSLARARALTEIFLPAWRIAPGAPRLGLHEEDLSALGPIAAVLYLPPFVPPWAPLDEALRVFVDGVRETLALARALGHRPVVLASTLEVLGAREGALFEGSPDEPPFPLARVRGREHWRLEEEIERAFALVQDVRAQHRHADRRSRVIERAKAELSSRKEPISGRALEEKVQELERALLEEELSALGKERAQGWGFSSTRGYAAALAEQLLSASRLPFTVVRAGPLGAALVHPRPGALPEGPALLELWQRARREPLRLAEEEGALVELCPVDLLAAALLVALFGLFEEKAPAVLHASATPKVPLSLARLSDLFDLALRKEQPRPKGLPPVLPPRLLAPLGVGAPKGPAPAALSLASSALQKAALAVKQQKAADRVAEALAAVEKRARALAPKDARALDPGLLLCRSGQRIRASHLAALERRLFGAVEAPLFDPAALEWRRYLLDLHLPALSRRLDEAPAKEERRPLKAYDNLLFLVEGCARRYRSAPALTLLVDKERRDVSFSELCFRARAVARRLLEAGVKRGDRVLLSGANGPDWVIACFGVLFAGAVLVPVDPALAPGQAENVARRARVKLSLLDKRAQKQLEGARLGKVLDLALLTPPGPEGGLPPEEVSPDEIASILFTSGTTGDPKGVMLSHRNFTSLLASLGALFDLHGGDRLLSVLPLHHTFEFTCGLLLPLAAGGQVFYLDELTGERVLYGLKEGRITAMVGVPALWQLLERRIKGRVKERGKIAKTAFDLSLELTRALQRRFGVDVGPLLFRTIHDELGGHLRTLISGGAALWPETHRLFQSLGLPLAEGYGLTEAAPVLTVAEAKPGAEGGTVGRAIPGVEVKLDGVDERGVGEVLARGPNVMRGYFEDEKATRAVLTDDGWLRTGDLGRFRADGSLEIVGRAKDVVVTAAGENIYLDDVEARIGEVPAVRELVLVGVPDPRGGERLALAFVPEKDEARAREALQERLLKLPAVFRPQVVRPFPGELPRTATRKVKRKDVRAFLEERLEAEARAKAEREGGEVPHAAVRGALAMVLGIDAKKISSDTRLVEDLGFDSLLWVELASALEPLCGRPDPEALYRCETVAALERYVATLEKGPSSSRQKPRSEKANEREARRIVLPRVVTAPLQKALGRGQRELYRTLFAAEVEGRERIPLNRPCIVVANHASHLDTGLVKVALGKYGEALRPLAAKDYFFEGHPLKVAFFEHLTNLEPIERESGSGLAFEQAARIVEAGHVVLIFPEGTRRVDGTLGPFKPLVGRLSLMTGVPVLPVHLSGTYEALPKGRALPRPGKLRARIGVPLEAEDLARRTAHLAPAAAARAATDLIREAVVALSEGRVLDLAAERPAEPGPKVAKSRAP